MRRVQRIKLREAIQKLRNSQETAHDTLCITETSVRPVSLLAQSLAQRATYKKQRPQTKLMTVARLAPLKQRYLAMVFFKRPAQQNAATGSSVESDNARVDGNNGTKGRKGPKPNKAHVKIVISDPQALSTLAIQTDPSDSRHDGEEHGCPPLCPSVAMASYRRPYSKEANVSLDIDRRCQVPG